MKFSVSALKEIYHKRLKRYIWVRDVVMLLKQCIWRLSEGRFKGASWKQQFVNGDKKEDGKVFAVICDGLTWANFNTDIDSVIYIEPSNWREAFEKYKPDIFFCEAAWTGLKKEWDGLIYRDKNVHVDNRFILKDILHYCRSADIPTVFWNKEDTPDIGEFPEDFIDTALLFDHIFTTAVECMARYSDMGHKSVHLMMFGYSEKLFYQLPEPTKRNTAIFFGSWYNRMEERCHDMEYVFDWVLSRGITLEIYDRHSFENKSDCRYPEKYSSYIHEAVPYEKTAELIKEAEYIININSVKNSDTMFARRVFEAMACGRIVISNESTGLRKLFPDHIWFAGEEPPSDMAKACIDNRKTVEDKYTFKKQLFSALKSAGIE